MRGGAVSQTDDADPAVLVEHTGHVCVLTINRPDARNAINTAVTDALGLALQAADDDPEVRVIVLTGSGHQSFCAGADLKALSRGENIGPSDPERQKWGFAGVVSHPVCTPVIAAVNGTALGGGTELVLSADLAVAAESASFGLPEVKRGLFAAAGGAFRIVDAVPKKVAMELLLTGRPITAAKAKEYGLLNDVVPDQGLRAAVMALATEIAGNAPLAVQASKRLAQRIVDGEVVGDAALWSANLTELGTVFSSQDAMEGPRAFAEKRAPVWQAR
ncbi:MAG: enoyl-CoA hydratase [Gordonia sp. (in: high G+C Gram-positive bacteria)]|nr:MAG: enoyl-CoA hydratase [Gordonia sp. (in: high G+C Gram-positive bacteria)]